ncbi:transcription-repair coupling factor [Vicingus serpentipes]|uniref:Transcription-repair-coupling factor n=1 Tax=Vicingus serpentipes TaxID=1926625 RepID=A0A5C6RT38_9FLAO|nr:transcription-repair coupling factor [Vicingus serpentipes]TXB65114.1 transcription-repair coupling factor [Vicingus serpentipes]
MNIPELKALFNKAKHTELIVSQLQNNELSHIHLQGMVGSSPAFVGNALYHNFPVNQLFILNDKEEAAYFYNDLEHIVGEEKVLFFPASYKVAYQIEETDNANILLRAEVLNALTKKSSTKIIVTFPDALSEKVVTKKNLEQNTFRINEGDELSIEFINDVLFEYGFEREDFVVEPGQFAIRGGIVDVFSFSNDNPYRIEFFGDEVESIRTFDPVSQLSIQTYKRLAIIPNVQTTLLKESRESFLDFMPKNTVLWCKDIQLTANQIQKDFDKALTAYKEVENSPLQHLKPEEIFSDKESFLREIVQKNIIEFGTQFYTKSDLTIVYHQKPQPSFNKNFTLLHDDIQAKKEDGFTNIILSDNTKQVERLEAIFEDIGKELAVSSILLPLHEGFLDEDLKLSCYTDHQIFNRYQRFKLKDAYNKKNEALTLKELHGLSPGDFITHIDHGVGRFSGLEKIDVNGKMQEAIRIIYSDNDLLYVNIHSLHKITKFVGKDGTPPKVHRLGSNTWQKTKQKAKSKIKEVAFDLIKLYAKRKANKGFQFSPDTYLQNELEASFVYEDTPDQLSATIDVKKDMEAESPMDRLVCGDVGFGKTEIAIRAAFKAVADSKQVAILVPTTILALQHYKTFKKRLKDFPCTVDYINRFKTPKQQKETIAKVANGEVDILIGTHRIVGKDVKFLDLGLLIIDEEQKFGVAVKDKLKLLKANVDTLTLTATPIPRTLQFSLMAARDLSNITTPPPNRQPVETRLQVFNEEVIRDAISYEVSRGGQVFFINNRVENIQEVAGMISRLCPDVSVLIAHGQMKGDELEQKMMAFVDGEYDVLVATTIIESGLDIPNANTIIINNANHFGLSDLHQMRGRVGRSNKKAFCYLMAPSMHELTPEARKRLTAIEQFSDLGSGFQIALRDLDIRGAGNLLGGEQSGFISDIGFDMYQKILQEAIDELKENEFKDLYAEELATKDFVKDCQLETDLEILIPDSYLTNIAERLNVYRNIDALATEEALETYKKHLVDRFGELPKETEDLFEAIRLRWIAQKIGFEKLVLKQKKLIGYFIINQDSLYYQSAVFTNVLKHVQSNPHVCKMKEKNNKLSLVFENVNGIKAAISLLQPITEVSAVAN